MNRFAEKRVLHIGRGAQSKETIKYLKSEGAYVIAADSCLPEFNQYRGLADEIVSMNVRDADALIAFAKEHSIHAVTNRGSDELIEISRMVNEAIGNPYLHTEKQWQLFMNKVLFREVCEKYHVMTPRTYYKGRLKDIPRKWKDTVSYPVIVKPADNGGAKGISVCYSRSSLRRALHTAKKFSGSHEVIVEEFVEGEELSFTYVIQNGRCELVLISDKYAFKGKDGLAIIPEAYVTPSRYYHRFLQEADPAIRRMILGEGLNNCTIFFQAICRNDSFYVFEAGLRVEGGAVHICASHYSGQNYYHFCLDSLLKADTDYDVSKENAFFHGKTNITITPCLRNGTIASVEGMTEIRQMPGVYQTFQFRHEGETISNMPVLSHMFGGIWIESESWEKSVYLLQRVNSKLSVRDKRGRDMLIHSLDPRGLAEKYMES